jgi:LmbE family N-acetylglucosaminyl deacetylase
MDAIPELADRLRAVFREHQVAAVLTHAYEGGHPDHDATALAVHLAAECDVIEFAGYHAGPNGTLQTQTFLPSPSGRGLGEGGPTGATLTPALSRRERETKAAMIACFRTQAGILARFDPGLERFRRAPRYDFTAPPHPGSLNYENWGWLTGEQWRKRIAAALEARCAA